MRRMHQKFFAALLACALAGMLGAAVPARAEPVTLTVTNKMDAGVFVALSMVSGGGEDAGDLSQGWWGVDPGQTRTITFGFYSPVYDYFYCALSMRDGKPIWASDGDGDDRGYPFWVHPSKAFKTHPDKPIKGGQELHFKSLGVSMDGKASLTFEMKKQGKAKQGNANAKPAKPAKSAINANAAITGNKVNIRSAPSLKASVLLQLNKGDRVEATGKTATDSNGDDWYQIRTPSGKTGWVFGRYIDIW